MFCCKDGHIVAMDALNEEWCRQVFIGEIEGAVEAWQCPICGRIEVTEMRKGVRKTTSGLLVIQGEEVYVRFHRV